MAPKWLQHGSNMAPKCLQNASKMPPTCYDVEVAAQVPDLPEQRLVQLGRHEDALSAPGEIGNIIGSDRKQHAASDEHGAQKPPPKKSIPHGGARGWYITLWCMRKGPNQCGKINQTLRETMWETMEGAATWVAARGLPSGGKGLYSYSGARGPVLGAWVGSIGETNVEVIAIAAPMTSAPPT